MFKSGFRIRIKTRYGRSAFPKMARAMFPVPFILLALCHSPSRGRVSPTPTSPLNSTGLPPWATCGRRNATWLLRKGEKKQHSFCLARSLSGWSPLGTSHHAVRKPKMAHIERPSGEAHGKRNWESPAKSYHQPPDLQVNKHLHDPNPQPLSLPTGAPELGNKLKPALQCPIQIPTPWICEHNKWLFKLLSLRVICYTAITTGAQCNQGLVEPADISRIHLHQAKWMWTQLSALVHLNLKGGGRVRYTHVSCCLWLQPSVYVLAHKMNWFLYSNSK